MLEGGKLSPSFSQTLNGIYLYAEFNQSPTPRMSVFTVVLSFYSAYVATRQDYTVGQTRGSGADTEGLGDDILIKRYPNLAFHSHSLFVLSNTKQRFPL